MGDRQPTEWVQMVGVVAAVAVCLVLSAMPVMAPSAEHSAEVSGIDVDRAVAHVGEIAQAPHVMGTPENRAVASYLVTQLRAAGLSPQIQPLTAPDYFGTSGSTLDLANVLARIEGTDGADDALVFLAHYDTVPSTPGANDNAAAVSALLEVGRMLAEDPPASDVILLFTDGEEPPARYGATAFLDHPWADDVFLAVNLEGIGSAGPSMLMELEGSSGDLVFRLAGSVSDPVVYSFMTTAADLIGGAATDFDVFREAGIPGFNFAYLREPSIYHTERDRPGALNVDGMMHHGSLVVGIARGFETADLAGEGNDAVFFTIPSGFVVRYATGWGIALALVAAGLVTWHLTRRVRSANTRVGAVLRGAGIVAAVMLAAAAVVAVGWSFVVGASPQMDMVALYVSLAVVMALACGAWVLASVWSGRRSADHRGGVLVVWAVLALAIGVPLPAIGYLFTVPLLVGVLVAMIGDRPDGYLWRLTLIVVVALSTFTVLVPAIDTFFLFSSPRPGNQDSELPAMIVIPFLLGFLAVGLIATSTRRTAVREPVAGSPQVGPEPPVVSSDPDPAARR
ncbi:MAG: M28 family peptidase [Acidimicrobiia bacterium]|nr:M28 family peptidase [Acidimicrobiia bacterium]